MTWYKLVPEHREESIANKVKTCKFMLGWLRYVWFVDKLVTDKVRYEWRNKVEKGQIAYVRVC